MEKLRHYKLHFVEANLIKGLVRGGGLAEGEFLATAWRAPRLASIRLSLWVHYRWCERLALPSHISGWWAWQRGCEMNSHCILEHRGQPALDDTGWQLKPRGSRSEWNKSFNHSHCTLFAMVSYLLLYGEVHKMVHVHFSLHLGVHLKYGINNSRKSSQYVPTTWAHKLERRKHRRSYATKLYILISVPVWNSKTYNTTEHVPALRWHM